MRSVARVNQRIRAIAWLTEGRKDYADSDRFECEKCEKRYPPVVLDLAHHKPVRKDRSGSFQSGSFGEELLGMSRPKAAKIAHVLCANCHRLETDEQRKAGLLGMRPIGRPGRA